MAPIALTALLAAAPAALAASPEAAQQPRAETAQPSPPALALERARTPAAPVLPLESVNLSLAYPLTLRAGTEHRHLACELGVFYSRTGALSGLSLAGAGVSRVDGVGRGVQIGAIGYWHGGPGAGVRLGSFFGVSSGGFAGLSATGVATIQRGDFTGAELAGFTSIATGALRGVQASGSFDSAGSVAGVQAAGLASVSRGPVVGLQSSGGVALADGVQGVQLSVVNIGGDVRGAQIGVVNIARGVHGAQIGVVNIADEVEGQALGLVPYNRKGGLRIATWYDSTQPFNLGVRFHAGTLYVMPTFAFDPGSAVLVSEPSRMRYALGTSLGLRLPFARAFVDLDVNESQRSEGWRYVLNESTLDLRYRLLAGYQLMPGFAAFAGGGVRQHFPEGGPRGGALQPELSLGMELL